MFATELRAALQREPRSVGPADLERLDSLLVLGKLIPLHLRRLALCCAMANRRRGRPRGPAHRFGPQTIYAAYSAVADYLPEALPTKVARLVGAALYVPPTAHPHARWIEVEFALVGGAGPVRTKILASGETILRASVERTSGPLALWRSSPCTPPDLPKQKPIGNSAKAIATQGMRLMKDLGER